MGKRLGKYKMRISRRKVLARKFGSNGYYTVESGENKGKRYPKPLSILKSMILEKK